MIISVQVSGERYDESAAEGVEELKEDAVDARLWVGAAADGWRVLEQYKGGATADRTLVASRRV